MKFLVEVTEHTSRTTTEEIEGSSEEEVRVRARTDDLDFGMPHSYREISLLKQTEGPWVTLVGDGGSGFYLDHQDRKTHNVVVFDRARGHLFTEEEIELLRTRLAEIGLTARDNWNGVGFGQISFLVDGRKGKTPLSQGQKALLLASR